MLNQEAASRSFTDVHKVWVAPEWQRRVDRGELPEGYRIRRCLILLPRGRDPIVKFNEEISWEGVAELSYPETRKIGDPVYLSDIDRVDTVVPPTVDGVRVAFVYLFLIGRNWKMVFDATPNHDDKTPISTSGDGKWPLGEVIAESINRDLALRAFSFHNSVALETAKIGLWAAPALVPSPLVAIAQKCAAGELEVAKAILRERCSPGFLAARVDAWEQHALFRRRREVFKQAIEAHREGQYVLSVHALMPQVEGLATDWLYAQQKPPDSRAIAGKLAKLREALLADQRLDATDGHVTMSVIGFATDGVMLRSFADWLAPTIGEFPSRHAIAHGRFQEDYFTEDMSIRVLLLLDTLHHLFSAADESEP